MAQFDVDLFVIGAGSGGVRASRIAGGHGAKVMVAEEFRIGGTCVIRGCIPKKLYAYASRFVDDFEDAAGYGWSFPEKPTFDWTKLVAAKEREITRLSGLYLKGVEGVGGTIVQSRAEIEDEHTVRLLNDGRKITAKYILVATGGGPSFVPEIPGMVHAISSNEVFDLKRLPASMLIVGGGYIAVEFASVFARLGTKITQVMRADNVLRGFDDDMRVGLRDGLHHAGIETRFGILPTKIEKQASGSLTVTFSDGSTSDFEQVLIATGRHPHTNGLGLDKAGVLLDRDGAVKVDAYSRTNVPSIYAVGDVTNRINLTPVAVREGHAFADTVFGGKDVKVDHSDVASAVFSTPEIGTVGLTETQARETFDVVDIYRAAFRPLKATLSGRTERMVMKIVVDGKSDRILGVHILGHDAGEMAQLLGIAVKMRATKADFDATMAVHPTAAEELVTMRTRTARYEK
ncbi:MULTISPECIES: glutathione-disulfide reductase [unclassified Beijerinckia]|uniref:glutathione-disulfide reductase n=1 Tax=unclassified Beijerinckia TaxID=2638183 RepID=UPI00089A3B22|nr:MULTISPECIES: glutathione-disulfide reductase [unclassified Beijerinckia]MDH7795174.1 glutathione reductase (NADPH) [Beijerinckia sp. GAS462]SEB90597.1 NADPH-glutathione reductase [Beijerinckia sp. 28-YEA-48]